MTATEVAAEIGVAERTVRRWITSGSLPAVKRGGVFEIDLAAARQVAGRSRVGRSAMSTAALEAQLAAITEERDWLRRVVAAFAFDTTPEPDMVEAT